MTEARTVSSFFPRIKGDARKVLALRILHFGAIRFAPRNADDNFARSESPNAGDYYESLLDALSKSKNVFNLTGEFTHGYVRPHRDGVYVQGDLFSLTVNLPQKHQKFLGFFPGEQVIESFGVVSSGSVFCAFADVGDYPVLCNIGHEYGQLARDQLESVTAFISPRIGPTPLHANYYLALLEGLDARRRSRQVEALPRSDVLLLATEEEEVDLDKLTQAVFLSIQDGLEDIYMGLSRRNACLDNASGALETLGEVFETHEAFWNTSWWNLPGKAKRAAALNFSVSLAYQAATNDAILEEEYRDARETLLRSAEDHPLLRPIVPYLKDRLKDLGELPTTYLPAISHIGSTTTAVSASRAQATATLVGALLGAIIGALLTYVFAVLPMNEGTSPSGQEQTENKG